MFELGKAKAAMSLTRTSKHYSTFLPRRNPGATQAQTRWRAGGGQVAARHSPGGQAAGRQWAGGGQAAGRHQLFVILEEGVSGT